MTKRKKRDRGYAAKRARGNMMYGPGCCAHDRVITEKDRLEMAALRRQNDPIRTYRGSWE